MKNKLFAEMVAKQKPTKKWLFFPVSFSFHTLIIAALVVTPLLTADSHLPPIKTIHVKITTPETLSLPVGRGEPRRVRGRISEESGRRIEKPEKPVRSNVLEEPIAIPEKIEEEDFADFVTGYGYGNNFVEGAPDAGYDPNGVIGAPPGDGSHTPPVRNLRVEQIPRLIKKVKPGYPELALRSRTQGRVIIEAETDIYGRVTRTKVISGNPLLNPAAVEAVEQWVYEPYIVNGMPRPVRFTVTLEFTLKRH